MTPVWWLVSQGVGQVEAPCSGVKVCVCVLRAAVYRAGAQHYNGRYLTIHYMLHTPDMCAMCGDVQNGECKQYLMLSLVDSNTQ